MNDQQKPPCDCIIKSGEFGYHVDRCICANQGDLLDATAWCEERNRIIAQTASVVDALELAAGKINGMGMAAAHANVFGPLKEAYFAAETEIAQLAKSIKKGEEVTDRNGLKHHFGGSPSGGAASQLRNLVDWAYLHATEGEVWPSSKTADELIAAAAERAPKQADADFMKRKVVMKDSRQIRSTADCGEFLPLTLKPLDDPNHDPGEHSVLDADTAYIFKLGCTRDRAERIVAALNAGAQREVTRYVATVRVKQLAEESLRPWQTELDEIVGHLGAAVTQSTDKDDRIIMDHVLVAHEIAKIVRRKA
ncbi:hypothetical protein ACRQ5Q_14630 [Bradyrhizobium sp. PMVTL-01]|uniref:hypothetical protein n=1 Tax=Bradyrhizobium sp. PMVTL-01 TaxID=3434999 RepID=UPI003F7166DB